MPEHQPRPTTSPHAFPEEPEKATEEILLDQNQLAKGLKFLGLGGMAVSDDDRTLLFSTDATGYRQYRLFTKNLATGLVSPPLAERVDSFVWSADNRHIFFVTEDPVTKRSNQLWRLDLKGGKPELVYEEKDELYLIEGLNRTKDRKFVVMESRSKDTWESRYLDASKPEGAFKVLLPREKGHKYEVEHRDGLFYIRTNKNAKNFKIVTAPVATPDPAHWKSFLPTRKDVLIENIEPFEHFLVLVEKHEGLSGYRIFNFATGSWREMAFPEQVYAAFPGGTPEFTSKAFRISYQSMLTPQVSTNATWPLPSRRF
jgi:oligopeptidase B